MSAPVPPPPNWQRNYWLNAADGAFYAAAMAVLSADTVLPPLVKSLGGPAWVIGLLPFLMMLGWGLPPLFVAHRINRLQRLHPFLKCTGVLQRLPFLITAIFLLCAGAETSSAWVVVAFVPLLSGLLAGISSAAWMELLARAIPSHKRASAWAWRNFLSTALGLGSGLLVTRVLAAKPGIPGFAWLYLIAFGLTCISYAMFCLIREPAHHAPQPDPMPPKPSLRATIGEAFGAVMSTPALGDFLGARTLVIAAGLFAPFYSIEALRHTAEPQAFLGTIIVATMIGATAGNFTAGWIGDRCGSLLPYRAGIACLFLDASALALFPSVAHPSWWLALAFVRGAGGSAIMTSGIVLATELCPGPARRSWFSLLQTSSAPVLAFVGLASAPLYSASDGLRVPAIWAALSLACAAWLAGRIGAQVRCRSLR